MVGKVAKEPLADHFRAKSLVRRSPKVVGGHEISDMP